LWAQEAAEAKTSHVRCEQHAYGYRRRTDD